MVVLVVVLMLLALVSLRALSRLLLAPTCPGVLLRPRCSRGQVRMLAPFCACLL
jgi:hypothetical protein